MDNPAQEPSGQLYSISYDHEPILGSILTVSKEVLGKASWLIRANKTKLKFFYALHNAISSSLQQRNMHQYFTERAENNPSFKDSPFTPKSDKLPIEYEYLELYLSLDGAVILNGNPDRPAGNAPLLLNAPTEQNLKNIILSCELPLEESIEVMKVNH